MPTGWLEEEYNSSPPYSPQYSPCQIDQETHVRGQGVANGLDPQTIPSSSKWAAGTPSPPKYQHSFQPDRTALSSASKTAREELRTIRAQTYYSPSNMDARESETGSFPPQLSTLPSGVGLGINSDADSDLDSLFGDSEAGSGLVEDSKIPDSPRYHSDERNFASSRFSGIRSANGNTYPQEIERLARLRFDQDFKRPTSQGYVGDIHKESSRFEREISHEAEPRSQLEGTLCCGTGDSRTSQIDLTCTREDELHPEVKLECDLYEPDISVIRDVSDAHDHGNCGGNLKCSCRPIECRCAGCDHSAEIDEMMRLYWQEDLQITGCGCGGNRSRCSCLPGLCHCDNCHEHAQNESSLMQKPVNAYSSHNLWPDPPPSPFKWRDVFPGGQKFLNDTGNWIIRSKSPPVPWKVVQTFEAEVASSRQNMTRQDRDLAIQDFYASLRGGGLNQNYGNDFSKVVKEDTNDPQGKETSACSCSVGGTCTCTSDACKCAGGPRIETHAEPPDQVSQIFDNTSCSCSCGGDCKCAPGYCQCDPSTYPMATRDTRDDKTAAVCDTSSLAPRRYLSVSDLLGVTEDKIPVPTIRPNYDYPTQLLPSRPDTPRPHPDTCPSTPYASEVRPNPFERRLDVDSIRQSVEPEVPLAAWHRESTPAYEDRSLTPSPISRRGDTDMLDSPYNQGSMPPLPPIHLSDVQISRAISPARPPLPPIPTALNSLKVAKRDDRHKSGVQGSKVDKRSATGSPSKAHARSKSRNITKKLNTTRQPQSVVGDLIEEGAVATGPQTPTVAKGRVAAAVANIEAQVNRQQEDKDAKQKDGTPVRRSQRKNKGVRTSLGSVK